jgi:hypothetical protein
VLKNHVVERSPRHRRKAKRLTATFRPNQTRGFTSERINELTGSMPFLDLTPHK